MNFNDEIMLIIDLIFILGSISFLIFLLIVLFLPRSDK
jgi:hypothetical protein